MKEYATRFRSRAEALENLPGLDPSEVTRLSKSTKLEDAKRLTGAFEERARSLEKLQREGPLGLYGLASTGKGLDLLLPLEFRDGYTALEQAFYDHVVGELKRLGQFGRTNYNGLVNLTLEQADDRRILEAAYRLRHCVPRALRDANVRFGLFVNFHPLDDVYVVTDETSVKTGRVKETLTDEVFAYLRSHRSVNPSEFAGHSGHPRGSVNFTLSKLVQDGKLRRVGRGLYELAQSTTGRAGEVLVQEQSTGSIEQVSSHDDRKGDRAPLHRLRMPVEGDFSGLKPEVASLLEYVSENRDRDKPKGKELINKFGRDAFDYARRERLINFGRGGFEVTKRSTDRLALR